MPRLPHATTFALLTLLALPSLGQTTRPATTRPIIDRIPRTTVGIDMIRVPGGRVTISDAMGHETTHDLKPFLIQRTEARWEEWDVFYFGLDLVDGGWENSRNRRAAERRAAMLKPSPSSYFPPDHGFGHDGFAIHGLSLHTVTKYIEWLNGTTGKRFRLPTEAEWEYACRAGGPIYAPDSNELEKVALYAPKADGPGRVATKSPNAWGLHDMLGNVSEWVLRADGTPLLAGGSYQDQGLYSGTREVPDLYKLMRSEPQIPKNPIWLSDGTHVGFRLVRDTNPADDK